MRRARGYVPRPISLRELPEGIPNILAVGAEEKGSVCFLKGGKAFVSQHLGDLKNGESVLSFEKTTKHIKRLLKISPRVVAHDLHPSYASTRFAARQRGVRRIPVQHHYAHIAACLAENGLRERVIGVSFDGVGLGTDGNTWGGEFLVADLSGFERVGHLQYCLLPGGDAAAKEPFRMAVAYLHQAFGTEAAKIARRLLKRIERRRLDAVFQLIEKRVNTPLTSSTGRLFDAAASLLDVCHVNTYEGQGPMEMESLVWQKRPHGQSYPYQIEDTDGKIVIEVSPMIRSIVADLNRKRAGSYVACKFHNTVAAYTLDACSRIRKSHGLGGVALSGGVFQNMYLTEKLSELLDADGFKVYRHRAVPPNDGGISLGQAAVAAFACGKRR
jgi:hydrogenase maturation protein HypF